MKIQILSDLHNEFLRNGQTDSNHLWDGEIPVTEADIIILAGDIDTGTHGIKWAIEESKRLAKPILYVPGNHEFYRHEYSSLRLKMSELSNGTNVHCLDYGIYIKDDVRFIGATLWTDYEINTNMPKDYTMSIIEKNLADHQLIKLKSGSSYRKFKPLDALSIHKKELSWIEEQLEKPFHGTTVVLSHHGPHPVCQHPNFPLSELSAAFHSDLNKQIEKYDIDLWIYGHTHSNLDTVVTNTRIVSNQAGYPGENVKDFDKTLVITV